MDEPSVRAPTVPGHDAPTKWSRPDGLLGTPQDAPMIVVLPSPRAPPVKTSAPSGAPRTFTRSDVGELSPAVSEEFGWRYGVNIAVVTGRKDRIVAMNAFRPLMPNRDSVRTERPGGLAVWGSVTKLLLLKPQLGGLCSSS